MTTMRGRPAILVLALAALSAITHWDALRGWWLWDDPQLLIEAIRQPALGTLFRPAEYAHLAGHTFTPLLVLSFKFDLAIARMRPAFFYAHQVIALTLAAILMYLLLRKYVADAYAVVAAAIFLTSWAGVYAARMLMIRHYVEGLVFALAAMLLWSYGRRWVVAAAICYFLAMLSKEVYAPLPLIFAMQSRYAGRTWREIAREMVAPAMAAIIWLFWRWFMIGLVGPFDTAIGPRDVVALPVTLWGQLVGPGRVWAGIVWAAALLLVAILFLAAQRLRAIAFLFIVAVVVIVPIAPVISMMQWRYSFAFAALSIASVAIAAGFAGRRWAIAVLIVLFATTAVNAIAQRRYYRQAMGRGIQREGLYVWTQPATAPTLSATAPPWYLGGLRWLREREGRGSGPRVIFSRYAVDAGDVDPRSVVALDQRGRAVPVAWQRDAGKLDPNAPLTIEFSIRDHAAHWRFGPPGAHFVFVTYPDYSAIPIAAAGTQRVAAAREKQFFRIVRQEPDGRWTISPVLPIPADGASTVWKRSL